MRVDLGAEVRIDTRPIHPDKRTQYSEKAFVAGEITYPTGESSKIIYLNTAMVKEGLPEDLHGCKRAHSKFPDESTANQFFDETEFEAYRKLGCCIGEAILGKWKETSKEPERIFKGVASRAKGGGRSNL